MCIRDSACPLHRAGRQPRLPQLWSGGRALRAGGGRRGRARTEVREGRRRGEAPQRCPARDPG
eukprot:10845511-Alexandrium_andersonii.AAC.1